MTTDIYISERNGNREIRIPILPETINFESGDTMFFSYDIMNKGETAVPAGVELASYSWSSEFPGKNRTDKSLMRGSWREPSSYHNTLMDWKNKGALLTLLVTGYPINADVYIEQYQADATGAFGDMSYEIKFKAVRNISVSTAKTNTGSDSSTKRTAAQTTKYTIKYGDTLWGISKRFLGKGAKWETIYNANKEIIEQTAKKYGYSNSNHGWWIFPGVTLTIPQ